jgi:acetylornithine deacetylase/succinyl-diaminopimelate desuccinylase-like protein
MTLARTEASSGTARACFALANLLIALVAHGASAEGGADPLARKILADLIAYPSSQDRDGSAGVARYAADQLLKAGFSAEDVQVVGPSDSASGVLARYRGRGEREPVIVLAHLDVVSARREDWSLEPFVLTEKDGYFYGRGSTDNKAGAATLLANFIRLRREGYEPSRDFVLILTGDEETDMESIGYFVSEHRDEIDAEFALNSDGGGVHTEDGKPVAFLVQAAEKVYLTLRAEVANPGGHSSLPRDDNAIYELAEALLRLQAFRFPVSLNEVTRNYFAQASRFREPALAASMVALAEDRATRDDIARLDSSVMLRAMMRTTCVATQLEGGHAENALPQMAAATINCRVLPQDSTDEVIASVERALGNGEIQLSVADEYVASPPSPLTPSLMKIITELSAGVFPGVPVIADMSTGATDGLYLRNAGIPTYGVSALGRDPNDVRAHGRDERVRIDDFERAVEYWYRLLRAL